MKANYITYVDSCNMYTACHSLLICLPASLWTEVGVAIQTNIALQSPHTRLAVALPCHTVTVAAQ